MVLKQICTELSSKTRVLIAWQLQTCQAQTFQEFDKHVAALLAVAVVDVVRGNGIA